MYSISEHYRNAINNSNPSYLTGTITFKDGSSREISDKDIALGGASITMQAVTQDVLEFGAAVLGQLDISIITDKNESRYKYYDGVIVLYFNIETENGVETIPLGEYIITEAEKEKTTLKLSAYDNLFKMDKPYNLSLVGTPYEVMLILAEHCDCELAEDEDYYKSLPSGDMTVTVTPDSGCNTYRQATTVIAQMCGGFMQADRYGKISLKRFSTTPTFTLEMSQRYSSTITDYICNYIDLVATGLEGTYSAVAQNVDVGMTMYMDDAPAWDSGVPETLQAKADNLMAYLETIHYTPSELLIISDPSIDCGDLVTVVTETGTVNTLITSYTWNFHGQMELQSVGKNPYLYSNSINKQRTIRDLNMSGGTSTPVAIYTFKNTRKFKCTNKLESLALVTFVATDDTFALFNATFQIDVDVNDVQSVSSFTILNADGTSTTYEVPYNRSGKVNVTIQYYYNFVALGTPYTFTLEKGSHLVTLHYPVNNIIADSINRFDVQMSADSGTVSVAKEKFLGTISGQGLAGKPKWDGTITVEENMGATYPIAEIKALKDMSASVSFSKPRRNDTSGFADRFGAVSIMTIGALGFGDEFGVNRVVTNYTMNVGKASRYVFNNDYVTHTDSFTLNTNYSYTSSELEIDSGRMCSVTIRTDDKASVEGVEVNA